MYIYLHICAKNIHKTTTKKKRKKSEMKNIEIKEWEFTQKKMVTASTRHEIRVMVMATMAVTFDQQFRL